MYFKEVEGQSPANSHVVGGIQVQRKSFEASEVSRQRLSERTDCEAVVFLAEFYNDNRDLLYKQSEMEQVANEISELVNDVPIEDYYKSHILDFLRSLIYYKDRHIVANQSRILAKLQDSKKKNIHYHFDRPQLNGLNSQ